MKKKARKIVISRETLRRLDSVQLSGPVGGLAVETIVSEGDSNDRRCEPSIASCHVTC
jgi:hypothetical protein